MSGQENEGKRRSVENGRVSQDLKEEKEEGEKM